MRQLTYRGIPYESTEPILPVTSDDVIGKYRGVPLKVSSYRLTPSPSVYQRKYRGIDY